MDNKTKGSATIAFVIGAVAGGIAALLFAPQTGAQMRRRLKRGAQDLRDKGEHLAHEVEDTVREKAETVTGALKGAASTEPKRHGEHETPGIRSRTDRQS